MGKNNAPKLSEAQYWEWRTTIAEMEIARLKLNCAELQVKLSFKDAEVMNIKSQLRCYTEIEVAKKKLEEAKKEYEATKSKIEANLGISLNNKMIDDTTFEVKDLPQDLAITN